MSKSEIDVLQSLLSKRWVENKKENPPVEGLYLVTAECLGKRYVEICKWNPTEGWHTTVFDVIAWMSLLPAYWEDKENEEKECL